MIQAFTEVRRSPLPPRQKPYLPPLPSTPSDQIMEAAADLEPPPMDSITPAPPPMNTASLASAPKPSPAPSEFIRRADTPSTPSESIQRADTPPVNTTHRDPPLVNSAAPAPRQPLDLEDALLRAFAPPSPSQMGPRQKPYLIPSSEEAEPPAPPAPRPPQAQRRATSSKMSPIQRAPTDDAPHAPRERATGEQARLLNALDLPPDTRIEGSWSAPAPVTIQRAIDTSSSSDPAPEPETAPDQEVDPAVVEQLAQKVLRILRHRLRTDRERRDL